MTAKQILNVLREKGEVTTTLSGQTVYFYHDHFLETVEVRVDGQPMTELDSEEDLTDWVEAQAEKK